MTAPGPTGRALALLAAAALIVAVFLPWSAADVAGLDLGLFSLGDSRAQPTVGIALIVVAAIPALIALINDAGWPRTLAGLAAGLLALVWVAVGPDGALTAGVVTTLAAAVGLLLAAALATGSAPENRRPADATAPDIPAAPPGHRLVAHTADTALEAWGPTRASCFAEAVRALVSSFAQTAGVPPTGRHAIAFAAQPDDDLLVELLEEVVYLLDARGSVVVGGHLRDGEDGSLLGHLDLAPVEQVTPAGAVPKAITYHELEVEATPTGWRCHVTVDV